MFSIKQVLSFSWIVLGDIGFKKNCTSFDTINRAILLYFWPFFCLNLVTKYWNKIVAGYTEMLWHVLLYCTVHVSIRYAYVRWPSICMRTEWMLDWVDWNFKPSAYFYELINNNQNYSQTYWVLFTSRHVSNITHMVFPIWLKALYKQYPDD